jgi:hypothetical protein
MISLALLNDERRRIWVRTGVRRMAVKDCLSAPTNPVLSLGDTWLWSGQGSVVSVGVASAFRHK